MRGCGTTVVLGLMLVLGVPWDASAKSLTEEIEGSVPAFPIKGNVGGISVDLDRATVKSSSDAITSVTADVLQRIGARGTDLPIAATVPGVSYVYNPDIQSFERSSQLGPVFSERTDTIGRNRFQVGATYMYAELDQINGEDLGLVTGTVGFRLVDETTGRPLFVFFDSRIRYDRFELRHHALNASATYGITERWDANVVMPLVATMLTMRGRQRYVVTACPPNAPCTASSVIDLASTAPRIVRASGDAYGIGDLLLRTKYRFLDDPVGIAGLLTLRVPTGDEEDFQGLGDTILTPALVAARTLGPRVSVYGNLGFEVNADDTERNRVRYGIGGVLQVTQRIALLADVIGTSSFVDDSFVSESGSADVVKNTDGRNPNGFNVDIKQAPHTYSVPRSDVVDVAVGAKLALGPHATAHLGVIVPVTDDGLRAEVIPTGGIEFAF